MDLFSIDFSELLLQGKGIDIFSPFVDQSISGWNSQDPHWQQWLDGLIVLPLFLMLRKQQHYSQVDQGSESIISIELASLNLATAKVICDYFSAKGWLQDQSVNSDVLLLTGAASYLFERMYINATLYAYHPMFSNIEQVIFGDCQAVFERDSDGHERHLDRTLNVLGSGFQHQKYFADMERMIISLFDQPDFANQPHIIADMGCGDGALLKKVYGIVANKTRRGQVLQQFPITLLGADYNEAALEATRKNLHGMDFITVRGDIGDPAQLMVDLQALGFDRADDILHIRSFMDHDRPFIAPQHCTDVSSLSDTHFQSVTKNVLATDASGDRVPAMDVLDSLTEHLQRWGSILGKHGLMVLEVHALSAEAIAAAPDKSESLHFDAYHRFSQQLLVDAKTFLMAAANSGLLPNPRYFKKYPKLGHFARITLTYFQQQEFRLRFATVGDMSALMALEQSCWDSDIQVSAALIQQRIERHPTGQFVLEYHGDVVGIAYSQLIDQSTDLHATCVDDMELLHRADGSVMQLLALNIQPTLQNRRFGDQLLEFVLQYASLDNQVAEVVGVTRFKDFARHADMSLQDYLQAKNTRGLYLDGNLRFHQLHGASIQRLVPDFRQKDEINQGAGVLIHYNLASRRPRQQLLDELKPNKPQIPQLPDTDRPLFSEQQRQPIVDGITATVQSLLVDADDIDTHTPLMEMGLDSADLLELGDVLAQTYSISNSADLFFRFNSIHLLVEHILQQQGVSGDSACQSTQPDERPVIPTSIAPQTQAVSACIIDTLQSLIGQLLGLNEVVDEQVPLLELGLDSADLLEMGEGLEAAFHITTGADFFFRFNTLAAIADHLASQLDIAPETRMTASGAEPSPLSPSAPVSKTPIANELSSFAEPVTRSITRSITRPGAAVTAIPERLNIGKAADIAIVGIACQLPGGIDHPDQFWQLLVDEKSAFQRLSDRRFEWPAYVDPEAQHVGIDVAGYLQGVANFEADFFRISPREARLMDPQQRLLLPLFWQCMEDAAIAPSCLRGSATGNFVGASGSDYRMWVEAQAAQQIDELSAIGTYPSAIANRLSYFYDLHGPSQLVDSACSSSLVALHQAISALQRGECEQAFVSGVNVIANPVDSLTFYEAGMLSKTGLCQPFSAAANGYVRAEGAITLLLKPLSQAETQADRIYAVIKGSAVNHGGQANSFTAPNPAQQAQMLLAAYRAADVDMGSLSYIEAHGTGTPLGDPIEIEAIKEAFSHASATTTTIQGDSGACAIGSVKGNIGHLEAAAGLAGLLKVILSMQQQTIPASLHCDTLNPKLRLDDSPFYIAQHQQYWSPSAAQTERLAGVSSFGSGGTNAHVVVQSYSAANGLNTPPRSRPTTANIVLLSAKRADTLEQQVDRLQAAVESGRWQERDLANVAYTSQVGRETLVFRLAIVALNLADLRDKLAALQTRDLLTRLRDAKESTLSSDIHGVYVGYVKRRGKAAASAASRFGFASDAECRQVLADWLVQGQTERALDLWRQGAELDWSRCYGAEPPRRIGLPVYPFAGPRYWLADDIGTSTAVSNLSIADNAVATGIAGVSLDGVAATGGAACGDAAHGGAACGGAACGAHPLVQQNISVFGQQRFCSYFQGDEFFLAHHQIQGRCVLPAVAYLEMVREAAQQSLAEQPLPLRPLSIVNTTWSQPFVLDAPTPQKSRRQNRPIYLSFQSHRDERVAFQVHREVSNSALAQQYCQGQVQLNGPVPQAPVDLDALRQHMVASDLSMAEIYEAFERVGMVYGPAHRALQQLYVGERQLLARLDLSDLHAPQISQSHGLLLHPGIVDSALQSVAGLWHREKLPQPLLLPFALQRLDVWRPCHEPLWAWLQQTSTGALQPGVDGQITVTITLCDDQGEICARLQGLSMRVFHDPSRSLLEPGKTLLTEEPAAESPSSHDMLDSVVGYEAETDISVELATSDWVVDATATALNNISSPAREAAPQQHLFVLGDDAQVWADRLQLIPEYQAQPVSLVALSLNSQPADVTLSQVLAWIQRSLVTLSAQRQDSDRQKPQACQFLCCPPAGDHAGLSAARLAAAVSAFVKSACREYPWLRGQVISTDKSSNLSEMATLLGSQRQRMGAERPFSEWRYQQGQLLRRQWHFQPLLTDQWLSDKRAAAVAPPWRERGVYLISGGLGGLGYLVASDIARCVPSATLVLTGRSPLTTQMQQKLDRLTSSARQVQYQMVDVCQRDQVLQLVQTIRQQHGAIHGVIHSAGVIDDQLLRDKSAASMAQVLAAKVQGCENLDRATASDALDFMLLFSSITALYGNAGQADYAAANAYLDQFAIERNRRLPGGHTLSVNWPYWRDGGMQLDDPAQALLSTQTGLQVLVTEAGIAALYQALNLALVQTSAAPSVVAVLPGEASRYRPRLEKWTDAMVEYEVPMVAPVLTSTVPAITDVSIHSQAQNASVEWIQEMVIGKIAELLQVSRSDVLVDDELASFGFESITLTQFANELNQQFDLELTPAVFYECDTVESFADYLLQNHAAAFVEQSTSTVIGEQTQPSPVSTGQINPAGLAKPETTVNPTAMTAPAPLSITTAPVATQPAEHSTPSRPSQSSAPAVAVIGISGQFPMAEDVQAFWLNLLDERDCIEDIPASRWDWRSMAADGLADRLGPNQTQAKWGGFIADIGHFDPLFFAISPREAQLMDPQQRLLLTYSWKLWEDAGYAPSQIAGTDTGVFIGMRESGYADRIAHTGQAIEGYHATGQVASVGPNRLSFFYDLHGPSEPVETACSSSLIAIHRGMAAIQQGSCGMVIAGGVNTLVSAELHLSFSEAGMLSADGRCKTFSNQANGYVRGEGIGLLLLKALPQAQADGDRIYGVFTASAENHGGKANSLTAPNGKAQAQLLLEAYRQAGVDPRRIGYIEAHGTGTKLGDPIECNGLKRAMAELYGDYGLSSPSQPHCVLGSVKSNIGHLEYAAGVAGVIKVLLQLQHQTLVKTLHCDEINPYIDFGDTAFAVAQQRQPWPVPLDEHGKPQARCAGVSSFGFGGANAHVVIEEYRQPSLDATPTPDLATPHKHLLVWSAKDSLALRQLVQDWLAALAQGRYSETDLASIAATLQLGREAFEQRLAVAVVSLAELSQQLQSWLDQRPLAGLHQGETKPHKKVFSALQADDDSRLLTQQLQQTWIDKHKYDKLLDLWCQGADVDWRALWRGAVPKRIAVPGYPFAQQSFWLPPVPVRDIRSGRATAVVESQPQPPQPQPPQQQSPQQQPQVHKTEMVVGAELLAVAWQPSPRPTPDTEPFSAAADTQPMALIAAEALAQTTTFAGATLLAAEGIEQAPVTTAEGRPYRQVVVCIDNPEQTLDALRMAEWLQRWIKATQPASVNLHSANNNGADSASPYRLLALSQGAVVVDPSATTLSRDDELPGAVLGALLRNVAAEYRHLNGAQLDLDPQQPLEQQQTEIAAELEYLQGDPNVLVAYRHQQRYCPLLVAQPEDATANRPALTWQDDQVLLITGGTRGLGFLCAQHFVRQYGVVKLLLTGREPLPPASEWPLILASTSAIDQAQHAKLQALQQLAQQGVDIRVSDVDLSDREALQQLLQQTQRQWGPIAGVLHCAGLVDRDNLAFIRKSRTSMAAVLAPKVAGLDNLLATLEPQALRFLLAFSSVSAQIPALAAGNLDYAMANAYMDAKISHCAANWRDSGHLVSIQWPSWRETGLGEVKNAAYQNTGLLSLSDADGLARLDEILRRRLGPVVMPVSFDRQRWQPQRLLQLAAPSQADVSGVSTATADAVNDSAPLALQSWLLTLFARELNVDVAQLDVDVAVQEYGVDSILLAQVVTRIDQHLQGVALDPAILIENPTLERLAQALWQTHRQPVVQLLAGPVTDTEGPVASNPQRDTVKPLTATKAQQRVVALTADVNESFTGREDSAASDHKIAIVGMACHYPDADNLASYWANLAAGRDSIAEVPASRWDWRQYADPNQADYSLSRWGAFLPQIEWFDADYFQVSPALAAQIDPLERQWLEVSVEALADAGFVASAQQRKSDSALWGQSVGVFVGSRAANFSTKLGRREKDVMVGIGQNFISAHLAHLFNFTGPNMVVDAACASSLTALHLAVRSLQQGESTVAIAGGVDILLDQTPYLNLTSAQVLSPDGRCKTFDESANGIGLGEGCGAFVLMTLSQAIAAQHQIYAVIDGSAINNDGNTMGVTTPNPAAQQALIERALVDAQVDAASVSYVETHGTGTLIGDPLELKGLSKVFAESPACGVGSVKTNIGHLLSAAGAASLTKVVLSLVQRQLPPTLHCDNPNPRFDFAASAFYPVTQLQPWLAAGGVLRAGISAFGLGGNNAHLIVSDEGIPDDLRVQRIAAEAALRFQRQRHWPTDVVAAKPLNVAPLPALAAAGRLSTDVPNVEPNVVPDHVPNPVPTALQDWFAIEEVQCISEAVGLGNAANFATRRFRQMARFDNDILRDHQVHGVRAIPGTALLDTVYRCWQRYFGDLATTPQVRLQYVTFKQPVVASTTFDQAVYVTFEPRDNHWQVSVKSHKVAAGANADHAADGGLPELVDNMQCLLFLQPVGEPSQALQPTSLIEQAQLSWDLQRYYDVSCAVRIEHFEFMKTRGSAYQRVCQEGDADFPQGYREELIEMRLSELGERHRDLFFAHAAFLDGACLVSITDKVAAREQALSVASIPHIPFMIEEARLYRGLPDTVYIYAKNPLESASLDGSQDLLRRSMQILDADGRVLVSYRNFHFKRVRESDLIQRLVADDAPVRAAAHPVSDRATVDQVATTSGDQLAAIKSLLQQQIGLLLQQADASFDGASGFYDLGLDSSDLLALVATLEQQIGTSLYPTLLFEYACIDDLSAYLAQHHGAQFVSQTGPTDVAEQHRASATLEVTASITQVSEAQIQHFLQQQVAQFNTVESGAAELPSLQTGFYDLGLDSTQLLDLVQRLESQLSLTLYPTLLFEHTDIEALAGYFYHQHRDAFTNLVSLPVDSNTKPIEVDPPMAAEVATYPLDQFAGETLLARPVWRQHSLVAAKTSDRHVQRHLCLVNASELLAGFVEAQLAQTQHAHLPVSCSRFLSQDDLTSVATQALYAQLMQRIQAFLQGTSSQPLLLQLVFGSGDRWALALAALCKTAWRENPRFQAQIIEVQGFDSCQDNAGRASQLLAQLERQARSHRDGVCCLQYRNESGGEMDSFVCYQQSLQRLDYPQRQPVASRSPYGADKTYLISGGLGGLGLLVAQHLLQQAPLRVLLLGRSALADAQRQQLQALRELAQPQGASVHYLALDIAAPQAPEQINNWLQQYAGGLLHGVFHCAGVLRDQFIVQKDLAQSAEVFAPKTSGLLNLDRLCADQPLDFLLAFSSLSAVIGNPAQSDYACANAFMDQFVQSRVQRLQQGERRGAYVSINWPLWRDGGMHVDAAVERAMFQASGLQPLANDIGLALMDTCLLAGSGQYVVMQGDVARLTADGFVDDHGELSHNNEAVLDASPLPATAAGRQQDIAIIGLAGRYPGADSVADFWQNLLDNCDPTEPVPSSRWDADRYYFPDATGASINDHDHDHEQAQVTSKWGAFIADADHFDAAFFQLSEREAALLDPQLRLMMETAWHTLEDAAYPPEQLSQHTVGVFIGVMNDDYTWVSADHLNRTGHYTSPGSYAHDIANRISYFCNFRGPSLAIETACSSSLIAIHQARQAMLAGECELALAGGVNLNFHASKYLMLSQFNILSPEGREKTFSANADGYVPGEGVGAVLLKPLVQAMADRDNIHGVIKGSALNHSGKGVGHNIPNVRALTEVASLALDNAGIGADQVTYIETHGTGTRLGDPIEVQALVNAFAPLTDKTEFCALGSKASLGHLESASGICSLTKVLLALRHQQVPGLANIDQVNPALPLANSPFYLPLQGVPWPTSNEPEQPRVAAINSFGLGGSNCFMLVAEAPAVPVLVNRPGGSQQDSAYLVVMSARQLRDLQANMQELLTWLTDPSQSSHIADIAFTLMSGRRCMALRRAWVVRDRHELQQQLQAELAHGATAMVVDSFTVDSLTVNNHAVDSQELAELEPERLLRQLLQLRQVAPSAATSARFVETLQNLAQAFIDGADLSSLELYQQAHHRRLALPIYAFDRRRYWLDQLVPALPVSQATASPQPVEPLADDLTVSEQLLSLVQPILRETTQQVDLCLAAEDNFFELGGDSLAAVKVVEAIESSFAIELNQYALFEGASVAELALMVEQLLPQRLINPADKPVKDQLQGSDSTSSASYPTSSPAAALAPITAPLSDGQRALWFLHEMTPQSHAYHIAFSCEIASHYRADCIEAAFQQLLDRHPALRTTIGSLDGEPVQQIHHQQRLAFTNYDSRGWSADQLHSQVQQALQQPFDLAAGPLLRVGLFADSEERAVLLLCLHHIIADGWSLWLLMEEFGQIYAALTAGEEPTLVPLQQTFSEVVAAQQAWLDGPDGQQLAEYWQQQLTGEVPSLNLPMDQPRPKQARLRGASVPLQWGTNVCQQIQRSARQHGVTPYTWWMAAYQLLLHRLSGDELIWVGSPMAARQLPAEQHLVGYFANPVIVQTDFSDQPTFAELLARVAVTTRAALQHQRYPFARLVQDLNPKRERGAPVLFQAQFIYQKPQQQGELADLLLGELAADRLVEHAGLSLRPYALAQQEGQFDLTLELFEGRDGLAGSLKYNGDLFHADTIERFGQHFHTLVAALLSEVDQPLAMYPLLTPAQYRQLADDWNQTAADYPTSLYFYQQFIEQAQRTPNRAAVWFDESNLSYRQLDQRSNQLAHYLRQQGLGPGDLVGICVERSLEMLVGLLAIAKSGAAYVPMDPAYPQDRIQHMLQDSGARWLVTEQALRQSLHAVGDHLSGGDELQLVCVDVDWPLIAEQSQQAPEANNRPQDLAYIIYTSGSTGKPKGVQISHRALSNFLHSMARQPGIRASDRLLAVTTMCFDIATLELYLPLLCGASVVIASREAAMDGGAIEDLFKRHEISLMQATPATWQLLLASGWQGDSGLKILSGGEPLTKHLSAQLLSRCAELWNMYGPTETTVWSCVAKIQAQDHPQLAIESIGRPINNTQIYILNEQRALQPIGVIGDLYIGGDGLASGYLNRDELNRQKFVELSLDDGQGGHRRQRLYCSGDKARYLANGDIEFLGRNDHQLKIHGYRIEPGEVEEVLKSHSGIADCVVVGRSLSDDTIVGSPNGSPDGTPNGTPNDSFDGNKVGADMLVAYWVAANGAQTMPLNAAALQTICAEKLPHYMVPTAFVALAELPLTPNNKVDRKALPAPQRDSFSLDAEQFETARAPTEATLVEIWQTLLNRQPIGIHDDFFAVGGSSLLAAKVIYQIKQTFAVRLPVSFLFDYSTIARVAQYIDQQNHEQQLGQVSTPAPVIVTSETAIATASTKTDQQLLAIFEQVKNQQMDLAQAQQLIQENSHDA